MKFSDSKFIRCLLICLGMAAAQYSVRAQQIIINELYNSSSTDEWLELVVLQDSLDIRGWDIQDFSSTGTALTPLTFTTDALWSALPKGTIIVVGTSATTFTEDTDPSDYLLIIKASNSQYFNAAGVFSLAGTSDAVHIRDASDTHIYGVSWGTANAGSLPAPKVHFASSLTSGRAVSYDDSTIAGLTDNTKWTFNNTSWTPGAGNTAANIAWINALRANTTGDGSGSATVLPDTVSHGDTFTIDVTYKRDTSFTITDMRIPLPPNFSWSHTTGDVAAYNVAASVSIVGDTVYFTSGTFGDSVQISIQNVTAPDSTALYPIYVQTKALNAYKNVSPSENIVCFGLPQAISDIKGNDVNGLMDRKGQLVTFTGIVTAANEFGGPSYVQDNSGGIGVFGSSFSTAVSTGDEVIVSGIVDPFNGLSEITSPYLHSIVSSGNTVTPTVVTCNDIKNDGAGGVENFEGLLVRINTVTVRDTFNNPIPSWTVSGSGVNYRLIDATAYIDIRVDNNVDFANTPAPQNQFDVVGVVGQFKSALPFIGGYQLMPRSGADILSHGPLFASLPVESNITSSSMRISWQTINNGTTRLRYGTTTSYELGVAAPDNVLGTSHAVDLSGLQPSTIYHVQAFSVSGSDTSTAADLIVITASPAASTGQINVYFNHSVNTSVAIWENALGNQDLVSKITTRINNAKRSIDVCLYSLSGSSQGNVIAAALVNAKNRGVKVRVICEHDNYPTTAFSTLVSAGIPLIQDNYDLVTGGAGLMHNKFFVFDERGGAPESVWVWTGSWNPTQPGTVDDWQNSIEIQDLSLAVAYTTEFNEMWGSSTDTPNQSQSRFGSRKTDNTPHHFVFPNAAAMEPSASPKTGRMLAPLNSATIPAELYFSPSDRTTSHIAQTLSKAQSSISSCILTFTRQDLADTIIARKNAGKKARIVMDNNSDIGNRYSYLLSAGVDVHLKGPGSGLLHHKYAVVDGDQVAGTPYLITGSHNWSNSAENSNNENTLIVQDGRVANLYLQEFAARYYEAGGTDSIHASSSALFDRSPASLNFGDIDIGGAKQETVVVVNKGNAVLNVSSVSSSNPRFSATPTSIAVPAFSSQQFLIIFSPIAAGAQNGTVIFTHNAPGSPDTVLVQGTGIDTSTGGGPLDVATSLASGWNMVSLPVLLDDSRATTVYPTATSDAFAYAGSYVTRDTLVNGIGYWVKLAAPETVITTGTEITGDTIPVAAAWNMIGAISHPVAVGSVLQSPSGIVTSNYFGYDGGYFVTDTLSPGRAYWVKVTQAGSLTLISASALPKQAAAAELPKNTLIFTDALGHRQRLYFGAVAPCEGCGQSQSASRFELPPVPPEGSFDVRFASGRFAEIADPSAPSAYQYSITLRAAAAPVSMSWHVEAGDRGDYALLNSEGKMLRELTGEGEISLGENVSSLVLRAAAGKPLPTAYALEQNYPNPFNPTTTIPFALPRSSAVTLTLYNALGEEVMTLLENRSFDAGYYRVPLNGAQLSTGLYFYRIVAVSSDEQHERFQQQRKLLLMK